jgi:hypothetical protein
MKKAAFLIIGIIYGFSCLGQKVVSLNDAVNVELPNGAEKINKEQAISYAGKKFNNDKILLNSISKRRPEHMYKVNDVLISLFTDNNSVKEEHLTEMKKGLDEMFKGNLTYISNLKKVNNNSVLVLNYIMGNVEYYRFFSYNANNSRAITGILEFDKTDQTKAAVILEHILNSTGFKD